MLFICLAVLGLPCCMQAFSSCGKFPPSCGAPVSGRGGFSRWRAQALACGLSSVTQPQLLCGMWNLPGQGSDLDPCTGRQSRTH